MGESISHIQSFFFPSVWLIEGYVQVASIWVTIFIFPFILVTLLHPNFAMRHLLTYLVIRLECLVWLLWIFLVGILDFDRLFKSSKQKGFMQEYFLKLALPLPRHKQLIDLQTGMVGRFMDLWEYFHTHGYLFVAFLHAIASQIIIADNGIKGNIVTNIIVRH